MASLEQELSREMDVPLGTTSVELDSRNATVRGREAAIGNFIADAMRARGRADVGRTAAASTPARSIRRARR